MADLKVKNRSDNNCQLGHILTEQIWILSSCAGSIPAAVMLSHIYLQLCVSCQQFNKLQLKSNTEVYWGNS